MGNAYDPRLGKSWKATVVGGGAGNQIQYPCMRVSVNKFSIYLFTLFSAWDPIQARTRQAGTVPLSYNPSPVLRTEPRTCMCWASAPSPSYIQFCKEIIIKFKHIISFVCVHGYRSLCMWMCVLWCGGGSQRATFHLFDTACLLFTTVYARLVGLRAFRGSLISYP